MSAQQVPVPAELSRLERLGLLGGSGFTLLAVLGLLVDRAQFFRSWLFAFLFWLGVAVGSLGLTMLNRLTGGLWGAVPRRFHEAAARTLPWMAIAFLPVLLGASSLYSWAGPEAAADELILKKAAYLNLPFFAARAVLYFGIWSLLATTLSRWSWQQDQAPDRRRGNRIQGLSGVGLVLLAGTTTFAAIDWGMSLAPHWFSTMYGVLYIVGWTLSALAFTIVLMARLAPEPPFDVALRPITVQDLGKLLLTFTMLWGYVNFSQWLIIWAGNTTEETPFYVRRLQGGWEVVGTALVVFHFALPFALLLSRPLKRSARALSAVAWLMLVMQAVDLYWLIAPDLLGHGTRLVPLRVHWLDVSALLGIGGLWLYLLVRQVLRRPVLPLDEPEVRALLAAAPAEAH